MGEIIGGDTAPLGAIGLTASAGLAGWLEFALLRRSLARRAGAVRIPRSYVARLWTSAILAGIAGATFYHFVTPVLGPHLPHILPKIRDGIIVCGVYGIVYFAAAMLLGVPGVIIKASTQPEGKNLLTEPLAPQRFSGEEIVETRERSSRDAIVYRFQARQGRHVIRRFFGRARRWPSSASRVAARA